MLSSAPFLLGMPFPGGGGRSLITHRDFQICVSSTPWLLCSTCGTSCLLDPSTQGTHSPSRVRSLNYLIASSTRSGQPLLPTIPVHHLHPLDVRSEPGSHPGLSPSPTPHLIIHPPSLIGNMPSARARLHVSTLTP